MPSASVPRCSQISTHEIHRRIFGRNPPREGDAARAGHREQIAVPGWLGGVGGQHAVRTMIVDELLKVGEKRHRTRLGLWRLTLRTTGERADAKAFRSA
jgi:hypothetical protein